MARLRYNGLQTTLGAGLTSTTITFAAALTHSNGTNVPTITGSDYIPLSILSPAGLLEEIVYLTAYTAAATTGTVTRGREGTPSANRASGDTVVGAATDADLNHVLAVKSYNPGSIASYAVSSTTVTDVDATNLVVTFTVPPSGNVLVAFDTLTTTYPGTSVYSIWSIREGSTTVASKYLYGTNSAENHHGSVLFYVTGLTPGDVKTYKWAHSSSTGGASITTHAGGIAGAAVMVVTKAP